MPTFPDLARFQQSVNREPLTLPINGKTYEFPPDIPLRAGITIARLREEVAQIAISRALGTPPNPNAELLDDFSETTLMKDLIGDDVLKQMEADGLKWTGEVERVGKTLIQWHLFNEDAARAVWEGAGEPNPPVQGPTAGPENSPRTSTTSGKKSRRRKPHNSAGRTSSQPGR